MEGREGGTAREETGRKGSWFTNRSHEGRKDFWDEGDMKGMKGRSTLVPARPL
jgi:hypothetical protein